MGKRSKSLNKLSEENVDSKKEDLKTKAQIGNIADSEPVNKKKKLQNIDDNTKLLKPGANDLEKKPKKKHKKTKNVNDSPETKTAKKIIFLDDEPQEVPASSGTTKNNVKSEKKKFLNDDEAEVKDEDIDKFCDELNEEDNVQFEQWVNLIEANFKSNTKKSK